MEHARDVRRNISILISNILGYEAFNYLICKTFKESCTKDADVENGLEGTGGMGKLG